MKLPTLPPALLARLEPTRRRLRRAITAIKREPDRRKWESKASQLNRRLIEIERDFFAGKETP